MKIFENLLKAIDPLTHQKFKFQGVHLGLMESWVRAHKIMKTAWNLKSKFLLISSCVVLTEIT